MNPWTPAHEDFRQTVRRFVEREIAPYVNDWEEHAEDGAYFPRELYRQAADIGLLATIVVVQVAVWLEGLLAAVTGCGPAAPTAGLCLVESLA